MNKATDQTVPPGAFARGNDAFFEPHHIEAARRIANIVERARLQARVTASYAPDRSVGRGKGGGVADLGDMAYDARRELSRVLAPLPRECAGVVLDVCGYEKGLQLVETERKWPRRSAKLVLRIALEQLAGSWGLSAQALGPEKRRMRQWADEGGKPSVFG